MASLQIVLLYASCVLICCIVLATAAPTDRKRRQAGHEETKVSVIFGALNNDREVVDVPVSRSKRHVDAAPLSDLLTAIDNDQSASPAQRRQRRSAVFYLTASMTFCRNYPAYCLRIEVDEGDVKVKIRLAEE